MVVNDIRISKKIKNKGYFIIEKVIMKCEKITERFLKKGLVSSYKSKNVVTLGWPRFQFLAIMEGENVAVLRQSDAFETKYFEFLY